MHSFLFPEDLHVPSTQNSQRSSAPINRKPVANTTKALPQMPTRAPPTIPQQNVSAPPPPSYAPPPIPTTKEKPAISVTELTISVPKQESGLRRTKSKWSSFKERRDAKAQAAATIEVVLPPLSPIVDEEFWRTGRYPTSPLGLGMVHVAF